VTPVPASKKVWIFDGSVAQYASVFTAGSLHQGKSCVDCHGGDATKNNRAEAHSADFEAIPGSDTCTPCHSTIVASSANGLHTTLAGYSAILEQRGFGTVDASTATARHNAQCTTCHVENDEGQTACGYCHVSVPSQAGGGLLAGHAFEQTPSMDNNCTACHGSRVKDEYYGQNNALLSRNKVAFADGSPWKAADFSLQPDVHKARGMDCVGCHSGDEMHGVGAPTNDDRYAVTSAPSCTDCHGPGSSDAAAFTAVALHTSQHVQSMDCAVCHAQPYKNCFDCHTDVTDTGTPFFKNNPGDPTLEARKAASSTPSTVAPDSLMTFRVGLNPKWTGESDMVHKKYVVLRHVPVDADTLTYTGGNELPGLIPNMSALPTWKAATPHTIVLSTEITKACTNCHGADYSKFWLTDPIANAEGWIPSAYAADETAANAAIKVTAPIPFD
jgi:hypothetical protein